MFALKREEKRGPSAFLEKTAFPLSLQTIWNNPIFIPNLTLSLEMVYHPVQYLHFPSNKLWAKQHGCIGGNWQELILNSKDMRTLVWIHQQMDFHRVNLDPQAPCKVSQILFTLYFSGNKKAVCFHKQRHLDALFALCCFSTLQVHLNSLKWQSARCGVL